MPGQYLSYFGLGVLTIDLGGENLLTPNSLLKLATKLKNDEVLCKRKKIISS